MVSQCVFLLLFLCIIFKNTLPINSIQRPLKLREFQRGVWLFLFQLEQLFKYPLGPLTIIECSLYYLIITSFLKFFSYSSFHHFSSDRLSGFYFSCTVQTLKWKMKLIYLAVWEKYIHLALITFYLSTNTSYALSLLL